VFTAHQLKTWITTNRTMYGKLRKDSAKSGQAAQTMTPNQRWLLKAFAFLEPHMKVAKKKTYHLRQVGISIDEHVVYY
jgi:hypothetical protein